MSEPTPAARNPRHWHLSMTVGGTTSHVDLSDPKVQGFTFADDLRKVTIRLSPEDVEAAA